MLLTKVFYNQFLLFPSDMKKVLLLLLCAGFQFVTGTVNAGTDMAPITTRPWQETVLSVTDLDSSARFFREIGLAVGMKQIAEPRCLIRFYSIDNARSMKFAMI